MSESLTLFDIETDLLNLMLCREAALDDPEMRPALRDEAVKQIDLAIRERISNEIQKVDGIAFYLREFAARAAAAKAEKDRLAARQRMWEAREERLKEIVTGVMLMTGKKRLEGNSNTLRLQKCPASVEIAQPALVPDEYRRVSLTLPVKVWEETLRLAGSFEDVIVDSVSCLSTEASKSKVAEALKQQIPCSRCQGRGTDPLGCAASPVACENCKGAGKVNQGVPGCRLVTDKMSLRVE